jgi:hypothetical protein
LAIASGVSYAPPLLMRIVIVSLLAAAVLPACRMNIGDACGNSSDCSITGDRQCDLAQPGGYCTVFSCDPDTCPQGACVEWRFVPSRTAETWCMKTCDNDGNCRNEYFCVFPDEINMQGEWEADLEPDERVARIVDLNESLTTSKICTALSSVPPPESEREGTQPASQFDLGPDGGI